MFFKVNSGPGYVPEEFAKRSLDPHYFGNRSVAVPSLDGPLAPYGLQSRALQKRDGRPIDPMCNNGGSALPDQVGRIFHPNELGHEAIAAYGLAAVARARAKVLGIDDPSCPVDPTTTCYSDEGSKAYASADALNNNIDDFCSYVTENAPSGTAGWGESKTYYEGTVERVHHAGQAVEGRVEVRRAPVQERARAHRQLVRRAHGRQEPDELEARRAARRRRLHIRGQHPAHEPAVAAAGRADAVLRGLVQVHAPGVHAEGGRVVDVRLGPRTRCCTRPTVAAAGSLSMWKFDYFDEPDDDGYEVRPQRPPARSVCVNSPTDVRPVEVDVLTASSEGGTSASTTAEFSARPVGHVGRALRR